jgi:hypothetical protein
MIPKLPVTFATPSIVNDTPQAHAKVERDYKKIVEEAVRYLGPERVAELNKEVAIARRGNRPDKPLNELVLAEWDAAPVKDRTEFSETFYRKHPQQAHSVGAVRKRLGRLLKAREQARNRDRKLQAALQRPSLVSEATGTE